MSESNFNVYLPLDTLFDMRLGQVRHYQPGAIDAIYKKRLYWDRKFTNWHFLSNGEIENTDAEKWEYSDDVLTQSNVSGIFEYISHLAYLHRENVGKGHVDKPLKLTIDTHGFSLSDDARGVIKELLLTIIQVKSFTVEYVDIGIKALTPEYVDKCFGGLVMYHAMEWLALHRDALINYTEAHHTKDGQGGVLSEVYLIGPMLQNKEAQGITEGEERKGFSIFKAVLRPFISFEFIHVGYFSEFIDIPEEETPEPKPMRSRMR